MDCLDSCQRGNDEVVVLALGIIFTKVYFMTKKQYHPETLSVRAGSEMTAFGENSEALFLNSSFRFNSAAQAAARFGGTEPGNITRALPIQPSPCFKTNWRR